MKKVYIIGGTMGVGKTSVCQRLKQELNHSVFLDGDWCWDAHPFQVTEETKNMVMENICFLLNQFIQCSAYENIIFCWVMHEQSIIDTILAKLDKKDCEMKVISLTCDKKTLVQRLSLDVAKGIRLEDVIERSCLRLPMYERLNTIKIDTTSKTIERVVDEIVKL